MRFFVNSSIVNFDKKEVHLEFFFKTGHVFNQFGYIFYCYNKTFQKKIEDLKNVMIGSISHDFRTPLNGLVATLQSILRNTVSDYFYKTYIVPCLQSADFLMCLADDMLVYTQISLNKDFRMYYEPVYIKENIKNIINIMNSKANNKGIKLITEFCASLDKKFCTEPQRLKQVLFNLVGNAIKFTFEGYVKIKVESLKVRGKNCLKISV